MASSRFVLEQPKGSAGRCGERCEWILGWFRDAVIARTGRRRMSVMQVTLSHCAWLLLLLCASSPAAVPAQVGATLTGAIFTYTVLPGDSLTSIGARFGMEPRLLARVNALKSFANLKPGQVLEVDNRHIIPAVLEDGIVVNLPQRMLFRLEAGSLQAAYPIAAGRPSWPTPTDDFIVVSREHDKTWLVPPSIQREMLLEGKPVLEKVPPGPDNPLGHYWLGLSLSGVGIHGTIAPQSIYHFQTHGCIRLHPDDIAELFAMVKKGDAGRLVYQPVLLFQAPDGIVYLEVHRDIYKRGMDAHKIAGELAEAAGVSGRIDWGKAASVINASEGVARDVTLTAEGETP
jgi:L,D-transpeptidase ErfK/SrfK